MCLKNCWIPMLRSFPVLLISAAAAMAIAPSALAVTININAGPTLAANADALAAFQRAAAQWETKFSDPITVTIDADLSALGQDNFAQTQVSAIFRTYTEARTALVADAADEASNAIVNALPLPNVSGHGPGAFGPTGFSLAPGFSQMTTANAKALNLALTAQEMTDFPTDGSILINTIDSGFTLALDNSGGVPSLQIDFETIAAREIGHILGFHSESTYADDRIGEGLPPEPVVLVMTTMDLFRFRGADDPQSLADFTSFDRSLLSSSNEFFDDLDNEYRLSTGYQNQTVADGNPANTWKDDILTGTLIGVMDPTVTPSDGISEFGIVTVGAADVRVLDLIGYDVAQVPEPSTLVLGAIGLLALAGVGWRRRCRPGSRVA